jgi:hypothetical protein
VKQNRCSDCGVERTDLGKPCPGCGAPPVPENRRGLEAQEEIRSADLEPYVTLRYIARLFKILAVLMIVMMFGEIITGFLNEGRGAIITLLAESTRLIVIACLMWSGGDVTLLLIDAGHDLRAARILLGRINAQLHQARGSKDEAE